MENNTESVQITDVNGQNAVPVAQPVAGMQTIPVTQPVAGDQTIQTTQPVQTQNVIQVSPDAVQPVQAQNTIQVSPEAVPPVQAQNTIQVSPEAVQPVQTQNTIQTTPEAVQQIPVVNQQTVAPVMQNNDVVVQNVPPVAGMQTIPVTQPVAGVQTIQTVQPVAGMQTIPVTQPVAGDQTIQTTQPVAGVQTIQTTQPVAGVQSVPVVTGTQQIQAQIGQTPQVSGGNQPQVQTFEPIGKTDTKKKLTDEEKKTLKAIIKGVVTVIIIAGLVAGTLFIMKKIQSGNQGNGGMPGGFGGFGGFGGGNTVTSVRTMTAKVNTLRDFVLTNGEVETQRSIDVFPSNAGNLVQLDVSLGSPVKEGDIIAYVDPSTAGVTYKLSPVVAPISGSVISSPVKVGSKVTTGSTIVKIGDINNLQVSAKIPERYVSDLKIGLKAEIVLEAYPNVTFNASIVKISPVLDASTRTKEVILNFTKRDARINAGMFAKVKLYTAEYKNQITVSQDSLVNNADKYYLYVVNDDGETVTKREVTLGKNVDGEVQILSGVKTGETIVTAGMLTLSEGAKIKDIDKAAAEVPATEQNQEAGGKTPADFKGKTPADFKGNAPSDGKGNPPSDTKGKTPADFKGKTSSGGNGTSSGGNGNASGTSGKKSTKVKKS